MVICASSFVSSFSLLGSNSPDVSVGTSDVATFSNCVTRYRESVAWEAMSRRTRAASGSPAKAALSRALIAIFIEKYSASAEKCFCSMAVNANSLSISNGACFKYSLTALTVLEGLGGSMIV